jgi:hypothetical protein
MIALCASAAVFVLLSFLSAFASRGPVPGIPVGPGGGAVSDTWPLPSRLAARCSGWDVKPGVVGLGCRPGRSTLPR